MPVRVWLILASVTIAHIGAGRFPPNDGWRAGGAYDRFREINRSG
jgi:hypothetical protein